MFKKILVLLFLVSFVNFAVCPMGIAKNVILPGGVKVDLKLAEPVSSKTANAGDEVNFLVAIGNKKVGNITQALIDKWSKNVGVNIIQQIKMFNKNTGEFTSHATPYKFTDEITYIFLL